MDLHSRRHLEEFLFSVTFARAIDSQHLRGTRFNVLTGLASLLSSLPLPSALSPSSCFFTPLLVDAFAELISMGDCEREERRFGEALCAAGWMRLMEVPGTNL